MGSTHDLQTLLATRDARIRELEIENMELKSKLDKYQMIFSTTGMTAHEPHVFHESRLLKVSWKLFECYCTPVHRE